MSEADTTVLMSPDSYFPYFPTGCYDICIEQMPLTLYGPPGVDFTYWAWLMDSSVVESGIGLMGSYAIDTAGYYQWTLGNIFCTQTSGIMTVTPDTCNNCQSVNLRATITCDPSDPASYSIVVMFNSPGSGATYTLGTDIGPIDPFSGTLTTSGPTTLTLTFTTLSLTPVPDSVTVQLLLTNPDGSQCYQSIRKKLPHCTWVAEHPLHSGDSTNSGSSLQTIISNALLVFPNPTSGDVTISYDYGTDMYSQRGLSIFDATRRK